MSVQKKSDQQLVSSFLSGNSLSIEHLILRHKDMVFRFILSKIKDIDLANDLFQDIFIKVIDKLREGKYNEEGKFISWVIKLSHNMIMDYFRKASRTKVIRSNDDFDIFNTLSHEIVFEEEIFIKGEVVKNLNVLISFLSMEQREVIEMRYFASMTFKEISEELDISINTALGRMRYALMNIRKLQEKHKIYLSA